MAKSPQATQITGDTVSVPVDHLSFDARNPRLVERDVPDDHDAILNVLWREMAVDEVALSIAANGFFKHEPLFVAEENDRLVVIEGNRRLAAVKLLTSAELRESVRATDLPTITSAAAEQLKDLPVIYCRREDVWRYVGFKHVNGPQVWDSYAKATYIAWVHNDLGVPLPEIAKSIGDNHSTVKRLYRGFSVLEQAQKEQKFKPEDRWSRHFSFSHLYTGLDYSGIQRFIALPESSFGPNLVPKDHLNNLGELLEWLYGSKTKQKQPMIKSQNPDLRNLDEVLSTDNGVAAMRRGLPLEVALKIGRGDERLFREALVSAKQALVEARGILLTGFKGERDLLETAAEIRDLALNIHSEMDSRRLKARASRAR